MGTDAEDLLFPNNGEIPPAIPDGDNYQVSFIRAEKSRPCGQEKVYLWFTMQSLGLWNGEKFFMACNVSPKGQWTASCKFWQAWVLAAGQRPSRKDRMSTQVFRGKVFSVRMRKVLKTAKHLDRTPAQQYSVVDELIEVMVGR
mgnify:CR=1 FL=1